MIGRMFQRRGNQLVEVTNPSVILADASNSELTQKAFYVSPDGNDASDGITQATALATIGEALNRVSRSCKNITTIYLTGGTYDENVIVDGCFVNFDLQGDVTITGNLDIRRLSVVAVYSSNDAKFTADIIITNASSRLTFGTCSIEATRIIAQTSSLITLSDTVTSCTLHPSGENVHAIYVNKNAVVENNASVTSIAGASATNVCYVTSGGILVSNSPITVTGSFAGSLIYSLGSGYIHIGKNINSTASVRTLIHCNQESIIYIGNVTITASNYTQYAIYSNVNSVVQIDDSTFTFTRSGNANVGQVYAGNNSTFTFSSGTLSIRATGCAYFLSSDPCGHIAFGGTNTTLTLNGSVTSTTANAARNGVVTIPADTTVSGTVTGKRYGVTSGGQIIVGGAGANRIPGNAAGTVNTSAFGFYG